MKKRRFLFIGLAILVVSLLVWGNDVFIEGGNFRVAIANELYRSGTLSHHEWKEVRREYPPFKSVLNLRGESQREWYQREIDLSKTEGVLYRSIGISANHVPEMKTMEEIVDFMRTAPKPLLIHCMQGADRTGLVAALYMYTIKGEKAEQAQQQLSILYGHFPWLTSRTGAMEQAFAAYVRAHPAP